MAPRQTLPERADAGISALGLVAPPPISVETPTFSGSLATLFQCVKRHEVDLMEVPLFPICEAYFAYLVQTAEHDLDSAAAALCALATLLERKAWLLLPSPEPEPEVDEPMEWVDPTVHAFEAAIESLAVWHEQRHSLFFRSSEAGPDPYELPYELKDVGPDHLARAFEQILKRAKPAEVRLLGRPRRSLSDVMRDVLLRVSSEWRPLLGILPEEFTREDAVYTFLALLELVRLKQVALRLESDEVFFSRA